ncbi:MAG: 2-hydroxyacyl-CoA dehydratase family protein [Desulfobacteraceae bacterium]|nr:2-hydroxyacyl-CoA dehydratase family protein [Desulfobacteraceae bacterium]
MNRKKTETISSEEAAIRVRTLPHGKDLKWPMIWYFMMGKLYTMLPWKKTAWTCAGFPLELLIGFDIYPLHPENMATVAAAQKQSQMLIEHAESMGYSRDLCSYFKTNIGAVDKGVKTAHGGIAKPDIITCTNTICDTHWKWFQIQAEKLNVPLFAFDCPKIVSGTDERTIEGYISYMVDQFYEFFEFVKKHTGKELNIARMVKASDDSERMSILWRNIFECRKCVPSPYSSAETSASFFPLVVMPGKKIGTKFFEKIYADIKQRVERGEGTLTSGREQYRLLFEGIPFWYRMRFMYELARYNAVVTYEPYTFSFAPPKPVGLNYAESLRQVARVMMDLPYSYNLEKRIEYFRQAVKEYRIDGVILHENLSCRPSSTGMIDLKNALQQDPGIPVLILQCDMNDPRAYSDAQMKTRVESFIELMAQNQR